MKIAVTLNKGNFFHFWNYFDFIRTWNNRQTKNYPSKDSIPSNFFDIIDFNQYLKVTQGKLNFTFIRNEQGYCEMSRENASAYIITKILHKKRDNFTPL